MAGTEGRNPEPSSPDLQPYAGEWVVLLDGEMIDQGAVLKAVVDRARTRGIHRPRVLFVEGRDLEAPKLGL